MAELSAIELLGSQFASWLKLPATKMFSPQTVVAVTAKVTATIPVPPLPPELQEPEGAGTLAAPHEAGTIPARRSNAVSEAAYDLQRGNIKPIRV